MITLTIDGAIIFAEENETVLSAAKRAGIEIPSLCYNEALPPYASCGVCVVESSTSPRLLKACSTLVAPNMVIDTKSKRVLAAREAALSLLLSDHSGDCRPPCVLNCPAETDCQGYVGLISNGEITEAAKLIKEKIPLPSSIGRVCPHPCETACRRKLAGEPINISKLKYYASDKLLDDKHAEKITENGKTAFVIGGGPGGLSAAYFLRKKGFDVTVADAMPKMGGMLRYGIPEYRLPKAVLDKEIAQISALGVKMLNDYRIGRDGAIEALSSAYTVVIAAFGAWKSSPLRCSGEDLNGVLGGIDFLRSVHFDRPDFTGKNVIVVGGGNTAMDACRTAVRLGAASVTNVYRRTKNEMPAEAVEIEEAEEDGVIFKNLANPIGILGENGNVSGVTLQIMELGEPDSSGRRSPIPVEGKTEFLSADYVIIAIGQQNDNHGFEGLTLNRRGCVETDESYRTNIPNVFAIGDAVNKGADIAISAIGAAKIAAEAAEAFAFGKEYSRRAPYLVKREMTEADFADRPKLSQIKPAVSPPYERKTDFCEITAPLTDEQAKKEADRCLECGCTAYFDCKLAAYAGEYVNRKELPFEGEKHTREIVKEHPYILRDMNKCVLCGLCVRVCDERMGISALGLTNRGFSTVVSLQKDECTNCGQCVAVCPTGALYEDFTPAGHKQVPLEQDYRETVCSGCGSGCGAVLCSRGDMLLRVLPAENGILCETGRFGFLSDERRKKLTRAKKRVNGALQNFRKSDSPSSAIEELLYLFKGEEIGFAISGDCTNEEINSVLSIAEKLGSDNIFAPSLKASGRLSPEYAEKAVKTDFSANNYGLLSAGITKTAPDEGTQAIFSIGCNVAGDYEFYVLFTAFEDDCPDNVTILMPRVPILRRRGTYVSMDGVNRKL
ncbi:hypothetical protein FACS189490_06360 [Clostridia bacterium]|nr:hypothetical protein FACS189490_06360 [Clostridia bacterium]